MGAPKTLDDIEAYLEEAMETRTVHNTELATLMVELIGAVRHDLANQHAMIDHLNAELKGLRSVQADTRKEET